MEGLRSARAANPNEGTFAGIVGDLKKPVPLVTITYVSEFLFNV